jgi:5-methylthioadenosine/S-adenosylhomocysteine deaminase
MRILCADFVLPIVAGPIRRGAVAIEGQRIVDVAGRDDIVRRFPDAPVTDLGEAAILPGLVNCHSHLELTALRGSVDEYDDDFISWLLTLTKIRSEVLSEDQIRVAAIAGAIEGARAGVTCFGDIGRLGHVGFAALAAVGLRGIVYQETEFAPDDENAADQFALLIRRYEELHGTESGLVRAGLSPHSPYTVGPRLFELIAGFAVDRGVPLSVHAAESPEEEDLMVRGTGLFADIHRRFGSSWRSPGCGTIEYLDRLGVLEARPLLAHCVTVSEADIGRIAERGARIAHCPKSNSKFGHGTAPFERFRDAAVSVGFGTDSMASNNVCDIFEESRFAALNARNRPERRRFLHPREILETATLGGARAMGLEAEIGTLEPGKQADLIAVSLSSVSQLPIYDVCSALVFASDSRDVILTMVAGREVFADGRIATVDEEAVRMKVREIPESA